MCRVRPGHKISQMPQARQARDTADDLKGHYDSFVSRAMALVID